jgi:hypothetical protein
MDLWRLSVNDQGRERGASIFVITASLLLLFGVASVVVDGGLGWSERRQAQSGADFSTLAAAQFSYPGEALSECPASLGALAQAACRGAVEAIDVVDGNLPSAGFTLADWAACTDPENFSITMTGGVTATVDGQGVECISFSSTTQDARVRIPDFDIPTTFARVIGFDSLNTSAFAEVHASLPEAYRVLPFGIPQNAGVHDCLKSSPNPDWGVCFGSPVNGNFGYLDVPTYGNPDIPTADSGCTTTNNVLLSNMIHGVDHGLGAHPDGTATTADPALRDDNGPDTATRLNVCPIFGSNANEVNVQTGNIPGVFLEGMTYGDGTNRGPLWGTLPWRNGNPGNPAINLNDTPLWSFLTSSSTCSGGVAPTNTEEMTECLANWNPSDGIIFSETIRSSSRYAFAPRLWSNFSSAGWYLIEELQPIYLNTSYWGCNPAGTNPTGGVCDGIHTPGLTGPDDCPNHTTATGTEPPDGTCGDLPLPLSVGLQSVTSFQLERGMLPQAALDLVPSDGPLLDLALTR